MSVVVALQNRLSDTLNSEIAKVILGFVLLFVSAQIVIPMQPVPFTLQSASVLVIGLLYSRKIALQSVLLYLGFGTLGLPVFASFSGGFAPIVGPTGGYLIGFFLAIAAMTTLRHWFGMKSLLAMALNCALGTLVIFACGVGWLSRFTGFEQALVLGVLPFILPGVAKAVFVSLSVRYLRS